MADQAATRFLAKHLDPAALKIELGEAMQRVFANPDEIQGFFTEDDVQTTDGHESERREFAA
jgi:hypothetical protein